MEPVRPLYTRYIAHGSPKYIGTAFLKEYCATFLLFLTDNHLSWAALSAIHTQLDTDSEESRVGVNLRLLLVVVLAFDVCAFLPSV